MKKKKKLTKYEKQLAEWQKKKGPHRLHKAANFIYDDGPGIPIAGVDVSTRRGKSIIFDCPACLREDIDGIPFEKVERTKLLFLIPIFKSTEVFVICSKCRKEFRAKATLYELVNGNKNLYNRVIIHTKWWQDLLIVVASFVFVILFIFALAKFAHHLFPLIY